MKRGRESRESRRGNVSGGRYKAEKDHQAGNEIQKLVGAEGGGCGGLKVKRQNKES